MPKSAQVTETMEPSATDGTAYFRLRAQLLQQGRSDTVLAETDNMQLRLKVYASGGENGLHAHTSEDHSFVILQGRARFYDKDGKATDIGRYEGIMIPADSYFRFEAISSEELVLLRMGAKIPGKAKFLRIAADG
jgi:mannose-6-phosphate isomerase-like protein (cupin superfamily)